MISQIHSLIQFNSVQFYFFSANSQQMLSQGTLFACIFWAFLPHLQTFDTGLINIQAPLFRRSHAVAYYKEATSFLVTVA